MGRPTEMNFGEVLSNLDFNQHVFQHTIEDSLTGRKNKMDKTGKLSGQANKIEVDAE